MNRSISVLLRKDLLCLYRAPGVLVSCMGFALLLIVVSSFAFRYVGISEFQMLSVTPGILWLVFLFSGVITLNHSFEYEYQDGALKGLLLSPRDSMELFFSKFLSTALFLVLLQALAIFAHAIFFGANIGQAVPGLVMLAALVVVGFVSVGIPLAAASVLTRGREIILPLLLFPISIPLLAAAVFLSRELLTTGSFPFESFWFKFVLAFDLISFTLSLVLFEYALRE